MSCRARAREVLGGSKVELPKVTRHARAREVTP